MTDHKKELSIVEDVESWKGRLKESDLQHSLCGILWGGRETPALSSLSLTQALRLLWFKGAGRGFPGVFPRVPRLIPHGNWAKT